MPREWASFRPHALPVITVRRDAWALRALADTGAHTSLIHPRLVLQFSLPTIGNLSFVGVGSPVMQVPCGLQGSSLTGDPSKSLTRVSQILTTFALALI